MDFVLFRDLIVSGYNHPMARSFAERLGEHGEVQINMASGMKFSIHLGDKGDMTDGYIAFRANTGHIYHINWDQVEAIWTHMGSEE